MSGEDGLSETVAVGGAFVTVTGAEVAGALWSVPSLPTTRTAIASPRSPLPATPRSSEADVAPGISTPFFTHWYV